MRKNELKINKTKWDLSPLCKKSDLAIKKRKEIKNKSYAFINKWENRDDYLNNPKILKKALSEYEKWQRNYGTSGKEGYYYYLKSYTNQSDPKIKAGLNRISEFSDQIQSKINFFVLRLSKIDPKIQKRFLKDKNLKEYHHFLEMIFNKSKYFLSEPEEKIMTFKSTSAHENWIKMLAGFLSKEEREIFSEKNKKEKKNFSELMSLVSSKNKKTRDSAARAINEILDKHSDVAEAEINSILYNHKIDDNLRGRPRPDTYRHVSDDIDTEIVDILTDSVVNRFDISRKYYKLKAELMRVKKLEYHERNVEYGSINKEYSYQESINLVYRVLSNLDKDFSDILAEFVKNNQIDVYPKKGKRSGAACFYNLISQPTYVFLNHTNKLNDVLTLAHELGHGINDELMKRKQNALNFRTPLSTAEVASNFMEDFVLEGILKTADDEIKLNIMMMKLNGDISSIFRQIACYVFEKELHNSFREKGYLSKAEIGKLFQKHMSKYMGSYVEQSPGSCNWWIYWSHIRRFFYNYSYANGLLISKFLQASVRENPEFIIKVKEFLSTGSADSPENIFKNLGINIRDRDFWDKGINEVNILLKNTKKLAKKLGKV